MEHSLIPKHRKLTDEEVNKLYEKYSLEFSDLPKIGIKDKGIKDLDVKHGDVVEVTRPSLTSGHTKFFRGVMND